MPEVVRLIWEDNTQKGLLDIAERIIPDPEILLRQGGPARGEEWTEKGMLMLKMNRLQGNLIEGMACEGAV